MELINLLALYLSMKVTFNNPNKKVLAKLPSLNFLVEIGSKLKSSSLCDVRKILNGERWILKEPFLSDEKKKASPSYVRPDKIDPIALWSEIDLSQRVVPTLK